jgi:hypothetical protein
MTVNVTMQQAAMTEAFITPAVTWLLRQHFRNTPGRCISHLRGLVREF